MASLRPVALYTLKVPADGSIVEANPHAIPAAFRITMVALDPTAEYSGDAAPRSTLKIIRSTEDIYDDDSEDDDDDESIDSDDIEAIKARLGITDEDLEGDSEDDSDEDEEKNGGPSDPEKARLAREEALLKSLKEDEDDDVDMDDLTNGINGKVNKGKGKLLPTDDDDDVSDFDTEETVICTLDPNQHYQQALDVVINEGHEVYFRVVGTHTVYITGNYVVPEEEIADQLDSDEEDSEDEEPLDPALYGLEHLDEDSSDLTEDDELDELDDPRITEVASESEDDEVAPQLVKADKKKSKKRAAESDEDLDAAIKKILQPANGTEDKSSKHQAKKLKNNAGQAVAGAEKKEEAPKPQEKKEKNSKADKKDKKKDDTPNGKKVQFAEKLEQGPTGSTAKKGPHVVSGVTVDDKKVGSGPGAKKGDKVGMRYIGKLKTDGKVFDANKKGKPFTFKLGTGEVIKGWDIGVAGLAVGGERRITIPAHLAYGKKSLPGIPANSELVFDVKLLSIN